MKPDLKLVAPPLAAPAIAVTNFSAAYGDVSVIKDISLTVPARSVTCLLGPSGSGKSTLIRSLNRINDDLAGFSTQGDIHIDGECCRTGFTDVTRLRAKVGMVFQTPCVFPGSIAANVLFGVKAKKLSKIEKAQIVEKSLRAAALWSDVSHRLTASAATLSVGQQQRLCIARALAVTPDILLLDEPTASVDPVSAREIETLIKTLSDDYTIIMVTHDVRQAGRIADHAIFLCDGEIIEQGPRAHMFSKSALPKTRTYLLEEFCDC